MYIFFSFDNSQNTVCTKMPSISRDRPGKMAAATNVDVTTPAVEFTPVTRGEWKKDLTFHSKNRRI